MGEGEIQDELIICMSHGKSYVESRDRIKMNIFN